MESAGSAVSGDEEKDEDEELTHDDDEEDEDEINHTHLPKEVVRAPSPSRRVQNAPVWKHMYRITKYNVPDREIKADYTHICSVQKFQFNRPHRPERMGSVSFDSTGSTISGRSDAYGTCCCCRRLDR